MTPIIRKCLVLERWGTIVAGAKSLEVSRSQLSYCISGRRRSPELRKKLARALGMTVEELFGDSPTDKMPNTDSADDGRK